MSGANQQPNLSVELQTLLAGCTMTANSIGHSGSAVYRINDFHGKAAYLKIAPSTWSMTLRGERDALGWLKGRAPVPELLHYETYNGTDYLLTSEIAGQDASRDANLANPELTVRLYAEGVRMLHCIPIEECPLDRTLKHKLKLAERRIEEGLVDEDNLEEENGLRKPFEIYRELLDKQPRQEDLVFAHGDYCMPNVILDGERVSGFIDLGSAGIADRYQDLALAVRSLRHNYRTDEYTSLFMTCYGLSDWDEEKIKYYILLDELF